MSNDFIMKQFSEYLSRTDQWVAALRDLINIKCFCESPFRMRQEQRDD
jgi:hypothetical protein